MLDDSTGIYLAKRDEGNPTPAQIHKRKRAAAPPPPPADEPFEFLATAGAVVKDVALGAVEIPRQTVGGIGDAVENMSSAVESMFEAINLPELSFLFDPEQGVGGLMTGVDDPRSVTGGLVRSISQFLTGFLPASKAANAVIKGAPFITSMIAGAAADAAVFDPHEARLSDLIEAQPELANPVTEYLASNPDDSEAEGRFKNALEGLGLGAVTEGLFHATRAIRANRVKKLGEAAAAEEKATIERLASQADEVGGNQTAFHGTPFDFDEFDLGRVGSGEGNAVLGFGVNLAKDPQAAERYGKTAAAKRGFKSGKVFEFEIPSDDFLLDVSKPLAEQPKAVVEALKKSKYADDIFQGESVGTFEDSGRSIYESIGRFMEVESGKPLGNTDRQRLASEFLDSIGVKGLRNASDEFTIFNPASIKKKIKDIATGKGTPEPDGETFTPFEDPTFKVGSKKAAPEDAQNINLSKLDTADDVKELIDRTGEAFSKDINEARREIITHEETAKLADDLGMTVETLLQRRKGEAFNAEQALAARQILVASGENLVELAKAASAGADIDLIKFRKAMANHHAIQLQVSGATAEAGRALQSFRIAAKSEKEQARAIKEAINAGGGVESSRDLADKLLALESPNQINAFIKQSAGAKTKAMVFEAWINGLLSNPATHVVNILGNTISAGWAVGERKVASIIGAGLDAQSIPSGEASAALFGVVQGAKDGMGLAWHALKTGEPADVVTKMEVQGHKAISAENLELSGPAGRFADFVGETVRVPGRMLTAMDEFFKSVGYRMEMQAQAFRQASSEGLDPDAMAIRIREIIDNPPENIHLAATDAARYQTFTKPLGESGQAGQDWIRKTPYARVIMPFVRTPTNIVKYMGERTILAPLAEGVQAELRAGGARRDLALAKIATGSTVMAAAADFTMSGQITGGGPKHPAMRSALMATGWQPYSVLVDGTYYSYGRLDPIGGLIGIAADASEIMGQVTDADAIDLGIAAAAGVAQNVTSKTYLRGLAEFFDMMSGIGTDPESRNTQAINYFARLAGSTIPSGVAAVERVVDPTLSGTRDKTSAVNTILQSIQARLPGYSADLPPRRNIFGEVIVLSGGLGPDIMSPIYASTDKEDPVADEIVKQQTIVRMPRPIVSIGGAKIELNTFEYDQFIRFYAGEENDFAKMTLHERLNEEMNSKGYKRASDGQEGEKSLRIQAVFQEYKQKAIGMMLKTYPEISLEIKRQRNEKAAKLGAQ